MPKPMLQRPQTQTNSDSLLSATQQNKTNQQAQQMNQMMLERLLRKPRSKRYMDAIHKLDSGGHVHNQHKVDEIKNAIREEFPEVELAGVMLGIVSKCYLGAPYEVHNLDIVGDIIEHYEAGRRMPGKLENARGIAVHGGYDFIEVYSDCFRCVSPNGAVSVIKA